MGVEVVRDLSFSIKPQSFQFLTGPSGAGKTTLLRLMLLSLKPTRGIVKIFGQDASTLDKDAITGLRRRIGVVFQDFRLLDHLTTYENVALPLRVMGRAEASYRAEVVELLRWVGLGERMNALPAVLSGGEKQRAAIARALIARPELLLADEPTGNVDPGLARRLLRLFVELHKSGTAVVIATHDLALMDQFGEARRLVVGDGRLANLRRRFAMSAVPSASDRQAGPDIQPDKALRRDMPLVPASSIAGRALVIVIAIMTFLACLTAGGAILVAAASQDWRGEVSREVTIQIKPTPGQDIEAAVAKAAETARKAAGVADVHGFIQAGIRAIARTLARQWPGS